MLVVPPPRVARLWPCDNDNNRSSCRLSDLLCVSECANGLCTTTETSKIFKRREPHLKNNARYKCRDDGWLGSLHDLSSRFVRSRCVPKPLCADMMPLWRSSARDQFIRSLKMMKDCQNGRDLHWETAALVASDGAGLENVKSHPYCAAIRVDANRFLDIGYQSSRMISKVGDEKKCATARAIVQPFLHNFVGRDKGTIKKKKTWCT